MSQGYTQSFTGASSAQMAAETAANVAVTPSVAKAAPGAAKAWVVFNGTGTPAIGASYNVSSITDHGTGEYTINFTTPFSSANYAATGFGADTSGGGGQVLIFSNTAQTSSACRIKTVNAGGSLIDPNLVSLVFFGNQ
jgi:hypothetical protein